MVRVLTNKKNVKRESERARKLPEKKKSKNRDKNSSLFFSLPIGGGVGVLQ